MKTSAKLKKSFGVDPETGYDLLSNKVSGTKISRELLYRHVGCSYCFPHGFETINSTIGNSQRSWKKYRKTQYK